MRMGWFYNKGLLSGLMSRRELEIDRERLHIQSVRLPLRLSASDCKHSREGDRSLGKSARQKGRGCWAKPLKSAELPDKVAKLEIASRKSWCEPHILTAFPLKENSVEKIWNSNFIFLLNIILYPPYKVAANISCWKADQASTKRYNTKTGNKEINWKTKWLHETKQVLRQTLSLKTHRFFTKGHKN